MKSMKARIPKAVRESVNIIDTIYGMYCQCTICGHGWQPMLRTGGRMFRGWWKCPERCYERLI